MAHQNLAPSHHDGVTTVEAEGPRGVERRVEVVDAAAHEVDAVDEA